MVEQKRYESFRDWVKIIIKEAVLFYSYRERKNDMSLKKNNYEFTIRTEKENEKFLELLKEAEDKIQQAVYTIIYNNFENLNNSIKAELESIIQNIEQVEENVSSGYEPLFKPIRKMI